MLGITKRELDFRYWLVFAILPLRTSTREKKGDLASLPFAACRCEACEAFARVAVLHGNIYLVPLSNRFQQCWKRCYTKMKVHMPLVS
jgi:hypothetical protein